MSSRGSGIVELFILTMSAAFRGLPDFLTSEESFRGLPDFLASEELLRIARDFCPGQ